ncbi:DUF805 domain-containing protein [Alkalicaulis satelles]|uniref:DUF805 domain-containing protein n=1 Tax=Alkalicaulis satelles TaxID=2609175 RepID=A0A5M6ZD12_9PROT|nr:DUF805 domain-containing protein [Alkalicaulis satelles]KAA5801717.1 DUF805 domain-containing protein [Alkalicaulis satelles]
MNIAHVLFSPNGRIGQQDFWIGVLILIAANVIFGLIPILGFFISLGLIWVGIAIYGKRLHDAGKSAWLHAIPWGVSILLGIIGGVMVGGTVFTAMMAGDDVDVAALIAGAGAASLLFLLSFVVWIGYTIWVGVLKGDEGENRFGPAPGAPPPPATPDSAA